MVLDLCKSHFVIFEKNVLREFSNWPANLTGQTTLVHVRT